MIAYAARLLPTIAPGLEPPTSVRRTPGDLKVTPGGPEQVVEDVRRLLADREGSVGVIVPDPAVDDVRRGLAGAGIPHSLLGEAPDEPAVETEFDSRVDVVPASLAKGLEFDHVVLLDPAGIVAGEPDRVSGLRRLYVCLTRAVTSLGIRHSGLPAELA